MCDFDFLFIYSLCGWDGSVADAALWNDARTHDLPIPPGRYFLADAGFGASDALLVPYRGVRYHLKEWRQANLRYVEYYIHQLQQSLMMISALRMQKNYLIFATQGSAT